MEGSAFFAISLSPAEIICNTKNFSNFTFGNHDTGVFIVCSSKLLDISDIILKNRQLFQAVADSTFLWCSLSRTRVI